MHTIDPDFILGIGRISEFGARKYHMRNFLMTPGMEWSRVYESGLRHLLLWWGGEELDLGPNGEFGPTDDPETNMKWSGMPHLLHLAWNVMVLYTYSRHPVFKAGDDRPGVIEYDAGDWKDWRGEFDAARGLAAPKSEPEVVEDKEVDLSLAVLLNYAHDTAPLTKNDANRLAETVRKLAGIPKDTVRNPAFLMDPVRAFFAAQNKDADK